MTPSEIRQSRLFFVLGVSYFIGGYFLCAWIVGDRTTGWFPVFAWEHAIPFRSEAALGYILVYPAMFLTHGKIQDITVYRFFARSVMVTLSLHFIIFCTIPLTMVRAVLPEAGDLTTELVRFCYAIDPPRNIFPSIHVSLPFLSGLILLGHRKLWGIVVLCMTAIIAVSVLLIKQHYVLDIVGAIVLVTLVYRTLKTTYPIAE